MRTVRYRHATLRQHLPSILAVGLDPARALAPPAVVWLHTPGQTPGAVLHVVERHGVLLADVILLDVQVPRSWLQRAGQGLWTCDRVIAPARLQVRESGDDVAASPLPEDTL
jgi:glyoxylase-like metal-dependent hydrolase (beta-lactamase superfamily II)